MRLSILVGSTLIALTGVLAQANAQGQPVAVSCTVIADAASGKTLYREGACDRRFAPMSTFKLPLAIMGFDAGVLVSPTEPTWAIKAEYNPSKRELAFPEVDPTLWEKQSIVWYSQQLTLRLGERTFADYVTKFDYGNMDVSGSPGKAGLTHSWLMSSLQISPDEQIAFLLKFAQGKLPVSGKAISLTRETIPQFPSGDGWVVHGKTGAGRFVEKIDGADSPRPLGWFVGWAQKGDREVVFATMDLGIAPTDTPPSIRVRDAFIEKLPELVQGR